MKRSLSLLAVAVLAAFASLSLRTADAKQTPCRQLKGKDRAPARYVKLVAGTSLRACVLPSGRVQTIATASGEGTYSSGYKIKQVAGRIVLYETSSDSQYQSESTLSVHDIAGNRGYTITSGCQGQICENPGASAPAAFVTGAGRAVAIISGTDGATVTAYSTLGTARVLDSGPAIAGLALAGNVATWTNAGVPRSARLTAG
jgi:hypothetical protein